MAYSGNPTVKQFKTDMLKFRNFLQGSLEEAYTRQAEELMENMRANVPVESGALKDSIRRRNIKGRNRVTVLVLAGGPKTTVRTGTGVIYDYALSVEFGDVDQKAEPFFYSAARLYKRGGLQIAEETLDQAIRANNEIRERRPLNTGTRSVGSSGGAVVVRGKI